MNPVENPESASENILDSFKPTDRIAMLVLNRDYPTHHQCTEDIASEFQVRPLGPYTDARHHWYSNSALRPPSA